MTQQENQYSADDALSLVSDKWAGEVLRALRNGNNRYGEMRRAIPGITKKMLTQTLRKLERSGLVSRTDYDETPPRVEYAITPLGESLVQRLTTLCEWSQAFYEDVAKAQEAYDENNNGWI